MKTFNMTVRDNDLFSKTDFKILKNIPIISSFEMFGRLFVIHPAIEDDYSLSQTLFVVADYETSAAINIKILKHSNIDFLINKTKEYLTEKGKKELLKRIKLFIKEYGAINNVKPTTKK